MKKKSKKEVTVKPLEFLAGEMKDGALKYKYKINEGVGKGFTHNVDGEGLFEDDLSDAFSKLNVHLAAIDDIFKHADVEVVDINKMRTHELALLFSVNGFSIQGSEETLSVILKGHKRISCSDKWVELKTPKIPLDKSSSYDFSRELNKALEVVIDEVEQYHNGKYTKREAEEVADAAQLNIYSEESQEEFDKAKV